MAEIFTLRHQWLKEIHVKWTEAGTTHDKYISCYSDTIHLIKFPHYTWRRTIDATNQQQGSTMAFDHYTYHISIMDSTGKQTYDLDKSEYDRINDILATP